jgi:hypothetical protein
VQGRVVPQPLEQEPAGVLAVKRQGAGQEFVVDQGQAVLVAGTAHRPLEDFRRGVQRGDRPPVRGRRPAGAAEGQGVDQPEVPDLEVVADQEQVARLDVQVLEAVAQVHQVQGAVGQFTCLLPRE